MKIVITTSSFGKYDRSPLNELTNEQIKYKLNPYGRKLSSEEVIEIAKSADGVIAGTESLSDRVLKKLSKLKVISRCGVGLDNVDLVSAKELEIKVFATPDGPALAVAELIIGLMLNLLRKISIMDHKLRNGLWEKQMGNLLGGKKVAIIGFGRIGQKVAALLMPFGVDIAYHDIRSIDCSFPAKQKTELLSWADIITLHCSATSDNKPIIRKEELKLIKKGAWLINTSRGGLVDEKALYFSLKAGHLSGAALDVFEHEPYTGPLNELDNVILTPHIGSYARESRIQMELQAVRNLINGLRNK